jgi:hypothetical protein
MTTLVAQLTSFAETLHPRRWRFFAATIGIVAIVGLILTQLARLSARAAFGAIGLAGLALVWTWGAFVLTGWFGPNSRISPTVKPLAALFLMFWFLVGSTGFVLFLWSVLFAGA